MFPVARFVGIWFSELICWDDPCLKWRGGRTQRAKGRQRWQEGEEEDTSPLSEMEPRSVLSLSRTERPSVAKITSWLQRCIRSWISVPSLFMWNSYGHDVKTSLLTAGVMRSFRGSSDYIGALLSTPPWGWLTLSAPQGWTPAPGPCRAPWSRVCLKTRLNPSQQLSQIRSQFSAKGDKGRHTGLQVQNVEQMLTIAESWRCSTWKSDTWSVQTGWGEAGERKYQSIPWFEITINTWLIHLLSEVTSLLTL